jgi:hypothetical protein
VEEHQRREGRGREGHGILAHQRPLPSGTLRGAIVHVPDEPDDKTYPSKKAEFDGKPTMGTYWLYGLKLKEPGVWRNGKIVDEGNDKGDVYAATSPYKEGGSILNDEGYLSIVGLKIAPRAELAEGHEAELAASQAATRKNWASENRPLIRDAG